MRRSAKLFFLFLLTAVFFLTCIPCIGAAEPSTVVHEDEIETLFDAYVTENDLNPDLISVAYEYTATGERWYHLEDRWYYSASLYKVPLMMLLTEREYLGELTKDTEINGMTLEAIEEEVLVNSNNPVAYSTLLSIAQPDVCRRLFCKYSDLPEEYYTWDFYGRSYFTARFMSDVMSTLYRNEARFPRMTDCLKRAQPDHYFRLKLGDRWEVAQKYGTYQDEDGTDWNHASGIVFTPHPFLLTVMTRYGGISETIIGDLAVLFCDYTIRADGRLASLSMDTPAPETPQGSENAIRIPLTPSTAEDEIRTTEPVQDRSENSDVYDVSSPEMLTPLPEAESFRGRQTLIAAALGIELVLAILLVALRRRRRRQRKRR